MAIELNSLLKEIYERTFNEHFLMWMGKAPKASTLDKGLQATKKC